MHSCPVCYEFYAQDRRPRITKCGHTVCTPCLKELHRRNHGVIRCPECRREARYANVETMTTNFLAFEEGGASRSHGEAREILLARHDSCGRRNLRRWLSNVERATRETIEAAEALLPTLSAVQGYLSQMDGQRQAVEDEPSLETLENLIEEDSRWTERTQFAAQQEVNTAVSGLGQIESSIAELRHLQREVEGGLFQPGAAVASPQGEEGQEEWGPGTASPRAAVVTPSGSSRVVVVARSDTVSLSPEGEVSLDLPSDLGTSCTTELEFKATGRFGGYFALRYEKMGRVRGAAGRDPIDLFWTRWRIWDDRVAMATRDPTTGKVETREFPLRERGCGLRWGTSHRVKVVEDALQYVVLLDGAEVGRVAKAAPRPPAAARVWLETGICHLEVSKFVVEAEGLADQ